MSIVKSLLAPNSVGVECDGPPSAEHFAPTELRVRGRLCAINISSLGDSAAESGNPHALLE